MKEIMSRFSAVFDEKVVKSTKENFSSFIAAHPDRFCLTLLSLLCLVFLFIGIDFYPLLDVDETRYAIMAKDMLTSFDWNSLMFNAQPFLEKPPLYFWLVAASIKFFGTFNEFAVRFPIALLSAFITFFTYFVGKKVISRKFGMISALVLLSSVFFLIFSHIAILDMVLTVFMTSALYCGFLTHFCEEKYKKYFWWYFYLFAGTGFLAKGILAIAIPVIIMFTYNLITKTLKDLFKPLNLLPGLLIFFIIVLPWHVLMYLEYGNQFIKEYFLVHHFARFINSASIGRERPFYYFVPVFLMGFLPWTFVFIAFLADGFKKLSQKFKTAEGTLKAKLFALLEVENNEQKLLLFASLCFVIMFIIFSSSSTKLPTYILPIFPAASLLTGYFWWISAEKVQNQKAISLSTEIFAAALIFAATVGSVVYWFLPYDLQYKISEFRTMGLCGIYLLSILLLLRLKTNNALSIFAGYIVTMVFIISLSVSHLFNLVYAGGENEIVRYASFARGGNSQLVTFDFAVKPSARIAFRDNVIFITDADFDRLDEMIKYRGGPTFVIVKNKNMEDEAYRKKIEKRLEFVSVNERYSLYVKDVKGIFKKSQEEASAFEYPMIEAKQVKKQGENKGLSTVK